MTVTFRAAMTGALLAVLIPTVAVLGVSAYHNGRSTVEDLTGQILEQTAFRIEERARGTFRIAVRASALVAAHFQSSQLGTSSALSNTSRSAVTDYLGEVLRAYPELSMVGLGLEESGDYFNALRRKEGIVVQELEQSRHLNSGFLLTPRGRLFVGKTRTPFDPRNRPWYRAGLSGGGAPAWTEAYPFTGMPQSGSIGISCAATLRSRDSKTLGVVSADFTLSDLSRFLDKLRLGERGIAFLIGRQSNGEFTVVAHPRPESLVYQSPQGARLTTISSLADQRVPTFLKLVPTDAARPGRVNPIRLTYQGVSYRGGYRWLGGEGLPPLLLCMLIPEADLLHRVQGQTVTTGVYAAVGLLAVVLSGFLLSARAGRWLSYLHQEADQIRLLNLDVRTAPKTHVWEVDEMGLRLEQMKAGLRSFSKFAPAQLVRSLMARGQDTGHSGERRVLTICFTDISGFTAIAERLQPEELVGVLSEYFDELANEIQASGGTVDKYIGDGVLAFWGAPEHRADHARRACLAALGMQSRIDRFNGRIAAQGHEPFRTRIGVHTGEVIVGVIGNQARLNYTVMGDAVNVASRVEQLCKHYRTAILITEDTYRASGKDLRVRELDRVNIRGRGQPILLYELLTPGGGEDAPAPQPDIEPVLPSPSTPDPPAFAGSG